MKKKIKNKSEQERKEEFLGLIIETIEMLPLDYSQIGSDILKKPTKKVKPEEKVIGIMTKKQKIIQSALDYAEKTPPDDPEFFKMWLTSQIIKHILCFRVAMDFDGLKYSGIGLREKFQIVHT